MADDISRQIEDARRGARDVAAEIARRGALPAASEDARVIAETAAIVLRIAERGAKLIDRGSWEAMKAEAANIAKRGVAEVHKLGDQTKASLDLGEGFDKTGFKSKLQAIAALVLGLVDRQREFLKKHELTTWVEAHDELDALLRKMGE
ncbi:hypothetical protein BQ8794_10016 [Mesorhizobium prunaredense]|uniref:Uncharacterized protein n=1 Tax=Mesorhizobium prunaredense TaxID=1631249 RepID=A0A1R3UYD2_9HYPH|nr:hypothetical protein [Mesorhizobium prunaredense]SIT52646.1 hypothetical protein BQ8794_10016 [Mesorhizobium prunaredense]